MRYLIVTTLACLAAAVLYYGIVAAYTPNIIVVPVIQLLSATASAVTAASATAALLFIAGALLVAYLASQGISRFFNPRNLSSPAVEIRRPWYSPLESSLAWLWTPNPNRHFNHITRNADGSNYNNSDYSYHRSSNHVTDHRDRSNHNHSGQSQQHTATTRDHRGVPSFWFSEQQRGSVTQAPSHHSNHASSHHVTSRGPSGF